MFQKSNNHHANFKIILMFLLTTTVTPISNPILWRVEGDGAEFEEWPPAGGLARRSKNEACLFGQRPKIAKKLANNPQNDFSWVENGDETFHCPKRSTETDFSTE